jgi:hypothetical protein
MEIVNLTNDVTPDSPTTNMTTTFSGALARIEIGTRTDMRLSTIAATCSSNKKAGLNHQTMILGTDTEGIE